jgi:hypothetical protein
LPYEFRWEERIKLDYQCMSFTNKKGKKKWDWTYSEKETSCCLVYIFQTTKI